MQLLGYFGVHARNISSPKHCGPLIHDTGIVLVEAMRYAINKVNKIMNNSFLFGNQLNYRIIDSCKNTATLRRSFFPTILFNYYLGVVGPPTSDEAVFAATVHSAYKAGVVTNSASSAVFEDRNTYLNFFRTIPTDRLQVEALVSIINYFNWSYVSTVNSYGTYGQRGMDIFIEKLRENRKCVAKRLNLPDAPTDAIFQEAVQELTSTDKAKVVIMFTTPQDTNGILKAAKHTNSLTWLSSTSWYADMHVIKDVEESANGSLILQYGDLRDEEFMNNFKNMTLKSNNHTWFKEFWSEIFNCSTGLRNDSRVNCTGEEDLKNSRFFGKYAPVKPVLNAVESIACAFRNSILELCPSRNKLCIDYYHTRTYMFEESIVKYLRNGNSSCKELNNSVNINSEGYYVRDFMVLNFDGSNYTEVGVWKYNKSSRRGSLQLSVDRITWKGGSTPVSVCSLPCKKGEKKVKNGNDDVCCFTCQKCGNGYVVKNNTCVKCGLYERADQNDQTCKKLPETYIEMNDSLGYTIIFGSCVGMIINTAFGAVFIKFRNTRVVKASSRELSFIIILSLYICFILPFLFLIRPSTIVCGLQRFIVGLSLTGCYTPLMLKTNRIYRIFKASQTMIAKPLLVGSKSQILICLGLISVQLLLGIMWVVGDPPTVVKRHIKHETEVAVTCKFDAFNVLLNLIPCFVLTAICTVYAFKTRKFPSNFNEAYSIGITMYISCFLWGIFIPLLLFLQLDKDNVFVVNYVISGFVITVAFITLMGLFGPKLRKLLLDPNVAPATEMFSEFQKDKHHVSFAPSKLATITEDATSEKWISLPRLRTVTQEFEKKDVSTNT